ncbi:hypothetical protein [Rubellimicrobium arenae]|uniref:hypothetical protein n=1 Tax=Rubellimicrobium arenae TaxID=2817372 RepID=UPI001B30A6F5|nr:hypothetical protein [Rubellimicrobium arenae]
MNLNLRIEVALPEDLLGYLRAAAAHLSPTSPHEDRSPAHPAAPAAQGALEGADKEDLAELPSCASERTNGARDQDVLDQLDQIIFDAPTGAASGVPDVAEKDDSGEAGGAGMPVPAQSVPRSTAHLEVRSVPQDEDDDLRDLDLGPDLTVEPKKARTPPTGRRKPAILLCSDTDEELTDLDLSGAFAATPETSTVVDPNPRRPSTKRTEPDPKMHTGRVQAKVGAHIQSRHVTVASAIDSDEDEDDVLKELEGLIFDDPIPGDDDSAKKDAFVASPSTSESPTTQSHDRHTPQVGADSHVLQPREAVRDEDVLAELDKLTFDVCDRQDPIETQIEPATKDMKCAADIGKPAGETVRNCADETWLERYKNPVQHGPGAPASDSLSSSSSLPPSTSSSSPQSHATSSTSSDKTEKTVKRPPSPYSITSPAPAWSPVSAPTWRKLDPLEKIVAHIRTAEAHGGLAITCKLGDDFHATVLQTRDATAMLTSSLRRELVVQGVEDLPYLIAWDWSPETQQLHLHGVVVLPVGVEIDQVRRAFVKACGRWEGKRAARQWDDRPIYDAEGWAGYLLKTRKPEIRDQLLEFLGDSRLTRVSRPLTQLTTGAHLRSSASPITTGYVMSGSRTPAAARRRATKGSSSLRRSPTKRRVSTDACGSPQSSIAHFLSPRP